MNSIEYNLNMEKSFFSKNNFYGHYSPSNLDKNMISCSKIIQFHYDTSFILNFISSLYIEIKNTENSFNYNIKKFGDLIENLNIQISNDNSPSSLSSLLLNTFTFYYKKFESETQNQNNLYSSSIPENQKPYFGDYGNILIPDNYIDNYGLIFNNSYNKKNIKSYNSECKFKEVLDEILKQKPENILGYLLYKIIYYNIILYNINIQNSVRINYLNKPLLTYNDINIDPLTLTNEIDDIRSIINDNERNIIELNRRFFINTQNDYLMEKNIYREKINSLNTIKDDFKQSQDKFNKSIRNYKYNINNYDMIKKYSKYVVYSLILIIIIVIILIYFNERTNNNFLLFLIIILMIILIYLFSRKFKYVIRERFTATPTCTEPSLTTININKIGYEINNIIFNSNIFFKLTYKPISFIDNKVKLYFNTLINEENPEIYVNLGKSFLGNNYLNTNNTFLNNWNMYSELSKTHLIYLNTDDFTHYYYVSLHRYTETIYTINRNLFEELPNIVLFNLTLGGGSGFDGITIKPAIFLIELVQMSNNNNYYLPQNLYILNGGGGYKTLPTSLSLNDNYYSSSTNNINFNTILTNINRYNSYHIVKEEIINKGLFFNNNISYHRINNNIPLANLPELNVLIKSSSINYFTSNYNNLYNEIDYMKCKINEIKIRATNTSPSSSYLTKITSSYTDISTFLTNISNKYNDIINCIIPKLNRERISTDSSEYCNSGNIETINTFQTNLLTDTITQFNNLKTSVLNETKLLLDKYINIKYILARYNIDNTTFNNIITSNERNKTIIENTNFDNEFNLDNLRIKRTNLISRGNLIYNNFINISTNIIPTYLLNDNLYLKLLNISYNENCFLTLTSTLPTTNLLPIVFNNQFGNGEVAPIVNVKIGKGFNISQSTNIGIDDFIVFFNNEHDILDVTNSQITILGRITREELNNKNNRIKIDLGNSLDTKLYKFSSISKLVLNKILIKLVFTGGTSFEGITIESPEIYVILYKIIKNGENFYAPKYIIILGGGKNYKVLPSGSSLPNWIIPENDSSRIDFYSLIRSYLTNINYNIAGFDIQNRGKFFFNNRNLTGNIQNTNNNCPLTFTTTKFNDALNLNLYNTKIDEITDIYNNININLQNIVQNVYNNQSILDDNKNIYKNNFDDNLNNVNIIYSKTICVGINLGRSYNSDCANYINLNIENIQDLLDEILTFEIIAYRETIKIYLLYVNKLLIDVSLYNFDRLNVSNLSSRTKEIISNIRIYDYLIGYYRNYNYNVSRHTNIADFKELYINVLYLKTNMIDEKLLFMSKLYVVINILNNLNTNKNYNFYSTKKIDAIEKAILANNYLSVKRKIVEFIKKLAVGTGVLEQFTNCDHGTLSNIKNEYISFTNIYNTAETRIMTILNDDTITSVNININQLNQEITRYINSANEKKNNIICYYNNINNLYEELLTFRNLIPSSSCSSLRTLNPTNKNEIDKHSSVYNFLVPYINNYANTIEEIMNNMRMNILTLGNKSFIMDKNIYLYELYLKKKKEITEFKLKFTDYVNKTELVRSNSKDLYNFIIFLIITYIIIIIGIYIYLYLIPSLLFVIIFIIIMIIIVMIFFTFKLGVSTRMLADKYYWSMMTLKKID